MHRVQTRHPNAPFPGQQECRLGRHCRLSRRRCWLVHRGNRPPDIDFPPPAAIFGVFLRCETCLELPRTPGRTPSGLRSSAGSFDFECRVTGSGLLECFGRRLSRLRPRLILLAPRGKISLIDRDRAVAATVASTQRNTFGPQRRRHAHCCRRNRIGSLQGSAKPRRAVRATGLGRSCRTPRRPSRPLRWTTFQGPFDEVR